MHQEKYNLQTRRKILSFYFHSKGIENEDVKNKYFDKYKMVNLSKLEELNLLEFNQNKNLNLDLVKSKLDIEKMLKNNISKNLWTFINTQKHDEQNIKMLRSYLVNKNFNLETIKFLELKFLLLQRDKIEPILYKEKMFEHNKFWRKNIDNFIANNKELNLIYRDQNTKKLILFLKHSKYSVELKNKIIEDYNVYNKDKEKVPLFLPKKVVKLGEEITLADALSISFESQNILAQTKDWTHTSLITTVSNFGYQQKEINEDNQIIKNKFEQQKKTRKTKKYYPIFNSQRILNEMKNREEEEINNLAKQMQKQTY